MPTLNLNYSAGVNMDDIDVGVLIEGVVRVANSTTYAVELDGELITFFGSGFTYDANGFPTGGTITRITGSYLGINVYDSPPSVLRPSASADGPPLPPRGRGESRAPPSPPAKRRGKGPGRGLGRGPQVRRAPPPLPRDGRGTAPHASGAGTVV